MKRTKGNTRPEDPAITAQAETIATSIAKAFDEWIRPELTTIIGKEAADKIADMDFESVLKLQYNMLYIARSHIARRDGAIFIFKLMQGVPGKATQLSKLEYKIEL